MLNWFPTARAQLFCLPPVIRPGGNLNTGQYRDVPIDFENPLFSEELVALKDYNISGYPFYYTSDGSNEPYCQRLIGSIHELLTRKTVAKMLQEVNLRLEPLEFELFVWDAYRPVETQVGIWAFFEAEQKKLNPTFFESEIYSEILKYVSDPHSFDENNPLTWPTHLTGASVDLTIMDKKSGELIDMGGAFDQMDDSANIDYFERLLAQGEISADHSPLLHRRLLLHSMSASGFTNYPLEFWHFDWGNQMHKMVKSLLDGHSAEAAVYGIVLKP